jgi:hypothetical protein
LTDGGHEMSRLLSQLQSHLQTGRQSQELDNNFHMK